MLCFIMYSYASNTSFQKGEEENDTLFSQILLMVLEMKVAQKKPNYKIAVFGSFNWKKVGC